MNNTNHDAIAWLDARDDLLAMAGEEYAPTIRPMFEIIELDRRLVPMEVTADDYCDPMRWWL